MLTKGASINTSSLRIPPQDLSAEQALLGSIMLKPLGIHDVVDVVTSEDFYAQKHKHIFKAMLTLSDRNDPIDLISVTSLLKELNTLDNIGGSAYLAELTSTVPSASNLVHYAETVQKKAALRKLIESAEKILELGYNEHDTIDSVFDRAEQAIVGLSNFTKRKFVSLKDTLTEAWERFDRLHKSEGSLRGVSTGYKDLDAKLAGFQPSDLIILAARPSMGKTSLALDIARNVAKAQTPVLIFSIEMSSQQLVDRVIAAESHVDSWKLRTGRVNAEEDFGRIQDALHTLAKAPLFIDDEASQTIAKMRATARRIKSEHGLGLIIVDYLQLMIPRKETDSMVQQVTEISRTLKALARELDVPVLAISQLSRAVEARGGRPRLSDLRDSGSIEQDADVVMFIHREDKYNENSERKNIAEILIEKHRNGPTGKIELYFDEHRVSFTSIEKSEFGAF